MDEDNTGIKPRQRRNFVSAKASGDILTRDPPNSLDAEEGLLASMIIDDTGEVVGACTAAKIRDEYFFKLEHQIMYSAMVALFNESRPIDEIVLAEYLDKRGQLERVGGASEIYRIAGRIETHAHFRQWLEIVRDKYFARTIIRTCVETVERAYENRGSIDQFIEDAEERFLEISGDRVGDSVKSVDGFVDTAVAEIKTMIEHKGEIMGVPTGFPELDKLMLGLHQNEMIVIAGRPGTGKTSIALNIAENAVFGKNPVPTLVFSLEMLGHQLVERMIASRARIDQHRLRSGYLDKGSLKDIGSAATELRGAPLWIDDTSGLSILDVRARARRVSQRIERDGKKLGLVVVDYLQLLRGTDPGAPREQEVAEISRGMKAMSKELRAPVVVLAQLNRASEQEARNPRASDLRESGAIEQDADAILLLSRQRKSATDEETDENPNWLIRVELAKQRNGPTGVVTLLFNRSYTRYESISLDERS